MKKRIALIYGGASSEHEVSVRGYEYAKGLLQNTKYEILPVYIDRGGEWHIDLGGERVTASLSANLGGSLHTAYGFIKIDGAVPLLHGEGGEDGKIQGALETLGIPYVGADTVTSAICIDKAYTKTVAAALGIPTVDSVSFSHKTDSREALDECKKALGFPMFVKPRRLGSSVGAFPVLCEEDFLRYFPLSMQAGGNLVTVERMIKDKRELECAFVQIGGERIITPPGEILIDGFYGYDDKYGGKTRVSVRAELDLGAARLIQSYSELLANELRLRHLARIDYFLTDGEIYFNEVNTFPGFTSESLYPKMLEAAGIPVGEALISFIDDALSC